MLRPPHGTARHDGPGRGIGSQRVVEVLRGLLKRGRPPLLALRPGACSGAPQKYHGHCWACPCPFIRQQLPHCRSTGQLPCACGPPRQPATQGAHAALTLGVWAFHAGAGDPRYQHPVPGGLAGLARAANRLPCPLEDVGWPGLALLPLLRRAARLHAAPQRAGGAAALPVAGEAKVLQAARRVALGVAAGGAQQAAGSAFCGAGSMTCGHTTAPAEQACGGSPAREDEGAAWPTIIAHLASQVVWITERPLGAARIPADAWSVCGSSHREEDGASCRTGRSCHCLHWKCKATGDAMAGPRRQEWRRRRRRQRAWADGKGAIRAAFELSGPPGSRARQPNVQRTCGRVRIVSTRSEPLQAVPLARQQVWIADSRERG